MSEPKIITIKEIRDELWKAEFRSLFPELKEDIKKYFANPSCGSCLHTVIKPILEAKPILEQYYGCPVEIKEAGRAIPEPLDPNNPLIQEGMPRRIHRSRVRSPDSNYKGKELLPGGFRRELQVFSIEEANERLKTYPPHLFIFEAMELTADNRVAVMFLTPDM